MGLYLNQNETRSQLSSKVAADLSQRLNKRAIDGGKRPEVILQNMRKTTNGGLFWTVVISILIIAALIYLIFFFLA